MSLSGRRCREGRRPDFFSRTFCLCAFFWALLPATTASGGSVVYRDVLVDRAEAAGLYVHREWLALGHYERRSRGALVSLAGGNHFFLAPDGREDPRAELRATLVALFDPDRIVKDGEHPRCAFPARLRWLARELEIDLDELPAVSCDRYEQWRAGLGATGITMVFPEAYMNNPASMFGHTLLRVDGAGDGEERDLLAYAINFAAEAGGDGGIAFAFKGIFGGYDGFFSVLPYYEKLKQYGDWENRDIWEYPLALTATEIDVLLEHVWELRGIPFQYFFFDDNCSYQLLALLEIARPELRLLRQFPAWAIPIDTVRVTAAETPLITDAAYRASPATRIRYAVSRSDAATVDTARALATGESPVEGPALARMAPDERIAALSLAYAYLRYLYLRGDVTADESAPRSRRLLRALSQAPEPAPRSEPPTPTTRPDQGHAMASIGAGGGVRDGDGFVEVSWRPVFHSLSDPGAGYAQGANLEIGRGAVRYDPERNRLRLEEVAAVDVTSITARDRLLRPVSWAFATGWRTRMLSDRSGDGVDAHGVGYVDGGAGLAYALQERVLAYGLLRGIVEAGDGLDEDFAVAPSLEAGALWASADDALRGDLSVRATRYVWGDTTTALRAGGGITWTLSPRMALVVELAAENAYGETWIDATIGWRTYFRRAWREP